MNNLFIFLLFSFFGCDQGKFLLKNEPFADGRTVGLSRVRLMGSSHDEDGHVELPDSSCEQAEEFLGPAVDLSTIIDSTGFSHKEENVEFLRMFHAATLPECRKNDLEKYGRGPQELNAVSINGIRIFYICVDGGNSVIFYDDYSKNIAEGGSKKIYKAVKYERIGVLQDYVLLKSSGFSPAQTWDISIRLEAYLAKKFYGTESYAATVHGEPLVIFQKKLGDFSLYVYVKNNISKPSYSAEAPLLVLETIRAYRYLLKGGYYHRDVKPENIIMIDNFKSQFVDFNTTTRKVKKKISVCTAEYLAPEVAIQGMDKEFDSLSVDLFSLGVTLLHIIKGEKVVREVKGFFVRGLPDTSVYYKNYCTNSPLYSIDNETLRRIVCGLLSDADERMKFWKNDIDSLLDSLYRDSGSVAL